MALRTNRLYLIKIEFQAVAIISAKDSLDAINKYLEKIGFGNPYAYFCGRLMTNIITIDTNSAHSKDYFVVTCTKTISGNFISIRSLRVVSCNDIFDRMTPKNINDPLFIRPTIEEVRNCMGFSKEPMYKLRKFCI